MSVDLLLLFLKLHSQELLVHSWILGADIMFPVADNLTVRPRLAYKDLLYKLHLGILWMQGTDIRLTLFTLSFTLFQTNVKSQKRKKMTQAPIILCRTRTANTAVPDLIIMTVWEEEDIRELCVSQSVTLTFGYTVTSLKSFIPDLYQWLT